MKTYRLLDKVALITGGSSGIGLATAKAFLEEGARVIITGRDKRRLMDAKSVLGSGVVAIQCDASLPAQLDTLVAGIRRRFQGLDVLFANAGVVRYVPFQRVTEAGFDEVFNINVKGVFFTVQKALPIFRPHSSIILNGSISSQAGSPGGTVYGPSKAAVRALARNLAAELAPRGIRVNVVSPGPIDTRDPLNSHFPLRLEDAKPLALTIPLGRFGRPDEVAQAVVFLASPDSAFMLGSELVVDGGRMQLPDGSPLNLALRTLDPTQRADPRMACEHALQTPLIRSLRVTSTSREVAETTSPAPSASSVSRLTVPTVRPRRK